MNQDSEDDIREGVKASSASACLLEAALACSIYCLPGVLKPK
jgi:hypothetical protein